MPVLNCELCSVIQVFAEKEQNAIQIHKELCEVYGNSCMSLQRFVMVCRIFMWMELRT